MSGKTLTPKQALFVREYLVDLNATQAAVRAGYSRKGAEVTGSQLLRNPKVSDAVNAAAAKRSQRLELTAEEVINGLRREANGEGEDTNSSSRVAALGLLGKHLKLFTEKHEHVHAFDSLTDEQLEARYRALVATVSTEKPAEGDE